MIDCNITINYLVEKQRMTKRQKSGLCKTKCSDCPLSSRNNGTSEGLSCGCFQMYYPEKAVKAVQKWSDEHPQKTYLSQFLEHYPNVQLYDTGLPKGVCPYHLGLTDIDDCDNNCVKCWNQTVEESEK